MFTVFLLSSRFNVSDICSKLNKGVWGPPADVEKRPTAMVKNETRKKSETWKKLGIYTRQTQKWT